MAIAVVVILLVIGSLIFHFLSPWYFTPIASNWGMIDSTVTLTFWVTGIVFVLINLFMAYAIYKYRYREGQKADYEPENSKLEIWLTVITTIGVAAMLAPGLLVWGKIVTVPDGAMQVEAVGQQWHWSFRFPGKDKTFGKVDIGLVTIDNPFGMVADDPRGQDDVLISDPTVHLPVGQPIKLLLRSKDVLHNFTVAQFRVKMDLVPGMETYMWFEPTRTGSYEILCEELCGIAHFAMRGDVVVQTETDFNSWLDSQATYAEILARPAGDSVAGKALYAACIACHGANGEGQQPLNAPKLSGQDSWYLTRQLKTFKTGVRGSHEQDVYGQQMAAMMATLVDETAINNVVAYISTLPDSPAARTVSGDTQRGAKIYRTCANCHGSDGQGLWTMNAPRQAGINDWYLVTQLKNFRAGIRGYHGQDEYGAQMAQMAKIIADDEAIDDLVAYINTLQEQPSQQRLTQQH